MTGLQKQLVPISLGQGIDTKTDSKQVVVGKLTSLQNGVFQTNKEIKKRFGSTALPQTVQGGGAIAAGVSLQTFKNELLELDGQSLYSYNSSASNWVNKGSLVNTQLSTKSVLRNSNQQTKQY